MVEDQNVGCRQKDLVVLMKEEERDQSPMDLLQPVHLVLLNQLILEMVWVVADYQGMPWRRHEPLPQLKQH